MFCMPVPRFLDESLVDTVVGECTQPGYVLCTLGLDSAGSSRKITSGTSTD